MEMTLLPSVFLDTNLVDELTETYVELETNCLTKGKMKT